jgi:hypothetical protein
VSTCAEMLKNRAPLEFESKGNMDGTGAPAWFLYGVARVMVVLPLCKLRSLVSHLLRTR